MDFAYTDEDEAFRAELIGWLDEHLPKFLTEWSEEDTPDAEAEAADDDADSAAPAGGGGVLSQMERRRAWQRTLNTGRWAAISWPAEWGGRDATVTQNVIYSETMARYRTPGIYNANGLWQIGPMIIRWGTDEQKDRWIPNILNADDHWCQGFSEPQAGSDLANLRTTAIADGDDYVLNGQKIWISSAHLARWGLFLVRTDADAIAEGRKHDGITALIVDMEAPGIDRAPHPRHHRRGDVLRDLLRRRPRAQGLPPGRRGRGLAGGHGHARLRAGGHRRAGHRHAGRPRLDGQPGPVGQPGGARRPGAAHAHRRTPTPASSTPSCSTTGPCPRSCATRRTGPRCPWPSSSGRYLAQTLAELAIDLLGPDALASRGAPGAVDGGAWNRLYVFQRYTSIGAGTTEVQKNIIADRAIKMPRQ